MKTSARTRGFTLVEMIVAVGLFAIVMLISITALLSLVDANRKAQALQSVMNNLNVAIDGMVRSIREGSAYYCGSYPGDSSTQDCTSGSTLVSFKPYVDDVENPPRWVYWFAEDSNGVGRLYKSQDGTQTGGLPVTSPEVSIDSAVFYVVGSTRAPADSMQPKITIVIKGTAGNKPTSRTTFHVQATAVQRVLDL